MKQLITILLAALACVRVNAQQEEKGSIRGIIENEKKEPLTGITISIEGLKAATITSDDGSFQIRNLPTGTYTLIVSGTGFITRKENITVLPGRQDALLLRLNSDTKELVEVIVKSERSRRYNDTLSSVSLRTDTRLIETPQSVQVISKKVIQDQQAKTLNDLNKNAVGVSNVSPFNEFVFRGFTSWNSTMYNGINGAIFPYNVQTQLFNVESVEYLRGPSSVLYSSGRPGGLINMNTKKPHNFNRYEANITYGSWNEMIAQFDATGPLSKNKKFCYRVLLSGSTAGSYRAFQQTENIVATPSLSYKFNEKSSVGLEYTYFYQKQSPGWDNGTILKTNADGSWNWKDMPLDFSTQSPKDYTRNLGHSVELTYKHTFNKNINLTFLNRYVYNFEKASNHSSDYADPIATNDTINRFYSYWEYPWRTLQSNLFASFRFNTWKIKHLLLAGIDYSFQNSPRYDYTGATAPSININQPDYLKDIPSTYEYLFSLGEYVYKYDTKAAYIQDQVEISKHLKISAGLRYDTYRFSYRYAWTDHSAEDAKEYYTDTIHANALIPKAGIVYNPWENIAIYASYSQSFEPQWVNSIKQGGPFPPTLGKQLEIGYKGDFFKNKLSTSLAVYRIRYENVLVQDPADSNGVRYISIPGQISKGIEMSVQGNLTKEIEVIINYAYNKVNYLEESVWWKKTDQQINTPKTIMGAFINYRFSKTALKGLTINAGMHHESNRVASWTNQEFVTPAFTYYDAGLGYRFRKIGINANFYNVFNKKYITGGYVTGLVYPGTPRSFRLNLNYTF